MPQSALTNPESLRSGGAMVRSTPFSGEGRGRGGIIAAAIAVAVVGAGAGWWFLDGKARFATPPPDVATQSFPKPVPDQPREVLVVPATAPAKAYLEAKEWGKARALISAALADFPQNPEWLILRAEVDAGEGVASLAAAETALEAGDLDRARAALTRAENALGETPDIAAIRARFDERLTDGNAREVALAQSRTSLAEGDTARAEAILAAFLAAHPDDGLIDRELRTVRARRQESEERRRAAAEQITNGQRAVERRDYDSALLAFSAALQHDPGSQAARAGLTQVTELKEQLAAERTRFDTALAERNLEAAKTSLATMRRLAPGSSTVVLAENEFQQSRIEQDAVDKKQREAEAALQAQVDGLLLRIDDPNASNESLSESLTQVTNALPVADARREKLTQAMAHRTARQQVVALLGRLNAAVLAGNTAELAGIISDRDFAERLERLHAWEGLVFQSSLVELTPTANNGADAHIAIRHALKVFPERVLHYRATLSQADGAWHIVAATLETE